MLLGNEQANARKQMLPWTALTERMVREALAAVHWREIDLALRPKGHPLRVKVYADLSKQLGSGQ